MFERRVIDDVRHRTDIVEIIGEHVPLKKQGSRWVARCPFHDEKTPSFSVSRDKAIFHCFGCKKSGDVITFVREVEGLDFREALTQLAERAGVEIPETRDPGVVAEERRQRDLAGRLYGALSIAAEFFERALHDAHYSGIARDALEQRGITEESVRTFRLGYAPADWSALAEHLAGHGVSPSDAELAGLLIPGPRGHHDRFRHRLMFPVIDRSGRVVAFSGRILAPTEDMDERLVPADAGKYVNSPESPIYRKHEHLYGLHPARDEIRRSGEAVLVEGNFDVVQMHQHGFRRTVAPLGTAFTEAQGALMRKFADAVTLAFDGDEAGRKARRAAHAVVTKAGLLARVVVLPPKSDPDSYLRDPSYGAQGMAALLARPMGLREWIIQDVAADAGSSDEERLVAARELAPYFVAETDHELRSMCIQRAAKALLLSEETIRRVEREYRRTMRDEAARSPFEGHTLRENRRPGMTALLPANDLSERAMQNARGVAIESLLWDTTLLGSARAEELLAYLTSPMDAVVSAAVEMWRSTGVLDGPALLEVIDAAEMADAAKKPAIREWVAARLVREIEDEAGVLDRCPSALSDALAKLARCRQALEAQATRRVSARAGADGDRRGEVTVLEDERRRRAEIRGPSTAISTARRTT